MFNKPTPFPKGPDAQSSRGLRTGTGGSSSSVLSDSSARAGNVDSLRQSDTISAGLTIPADQAGVSALQSSDWSPSSGNRLIVGPDVKLKGAEILDCDILVVEGRVEATMDSRIMRIAEGGAYVGTVSVDIADISGRFDGELTVRSQLVIHATGQVCGKIRYGKIVIEEGGEISGDIQGLPAGDRDAPSRAPESRVAIRDDPTEVAP